MGYAPGSQSWSRWKAGTKKVLDTPLFLLLKIYVKWYYQMYINNART